MNCINKNSDSFKKLLEASKLPSLLLEMRVAKWQEQNGLDTFPKVEDIIQSNEVNQTLKAVDILQSDKAKQVFEKGKKANWDLNKILTELQIPKEQKQLLLDLNITDREQLALELAIKYGYTIEINTAKTKDISQFNQRYNEHTKAFEYDGFEYRLDDYYAEESGIIYEKTSLNDLNNSISITEQEFNEAANNAGFNKKEDIPTQYYSDLTVPGGTNGSYIEANIETPLITPSIKGHSQFSTDTSIGWYRMDEKQQYQEKDIENLIEIMKKNGILEVNCN